MGNYNFAKNPIPAGTAVKIVHDKFTKDEEIPTDIMKIGMTGKVVTSSNMLQSRPNFKPITVAKVKLDDGTEEVYLVTNLAPK